METFCETVQFYLRHLEDSLYPVMTEDLEVRLEVLGGICILWVTLPRRYCKASGFSLVPGALRP